MNNASVSLTREEKKEQTRQALMNAALELVGEGENFSNISLREVAKRAGFVPTSFYRHFRDMEELGLNLVDQLGIHLRKLMRAIRKNAIGEGRVISASVEAYFDYVLAHPNTFYFMLQCRGGGTPLLRNTIRNELRFLSSELASDLQAIDRLNNLDSPHMEQVAESVVAAVAETTIDLLDLCAQNPLHRELMVTKAVTRIKLILLGADVFQVQR